MAEAAPQHLFHEYFLYFCQLTPDAPVIAHLSRPCLFLSQLLLPNNFTVSTKVGPSGTLIHHVLLPAGLGKISCVLEITHVPFVKLGLKEIGLAKTKE